ncbi:MAG: hypothetical protein ABIW76_14090 [Fibrobacteria bacterium]
MPHHPLLLSISLAISLTLCLASTSSADEYADSLSYDAKRRQILAHAPDERSALILGAAHDLARDGYFAEALDLIYSMQDTTGLKDPEQNFDSVLSAGEGSLGGGSVTSGNQGIPPYAVKAASAFTGYVQTAVEYEEWENVDTAVGARVRAKLEWDPGGRLMDRVTAVFQGSDRNAYFDLSGKGSAFGGLLKMEADGLVEKKIWFSMEDSLGRRNYRDSLDRLFLQAQVEGNTRRFGKPLSLVAPAYVETEVYRHDMPGSLSRRAFGALPGLEAVSDDLLKSLIISWDLRRTDYPASPSASNFRSGPVASGEWYGKYLTLDAETRFITYHYNRDTSLTRSNLLETRAGIFFNALDWLKVGVRTVGESETDDYTDSVDLKDFNRVPLEYSLQGSSWSVQPQVVANWASIYSANLGMGFTRGDYPILSVVDGDTLYFPLYQNYSADDWRAMAGISMVSKAIFFTLSLDYEVNWVANPQIYRQGSSKGFGLNGYLFWKFRPWFEIDVGCNATRRTWLADGYSSGNISDNLSLSLGAASRFP